MGKALSGRAQHLVDGKWVNLPIEIDSVRHERSVGYRALAGSPDRGRLGYVQYDFLFGANGDFVDGVPAFIKPRGFPEGYIETPSMDGYDDHPDHPGVKVTWFMIDELLDFPWDEQYFDNFTAREIVGDPFIEYFRSLKEQGAERIVLWV